MSGEGRPAGGGISRRGLLAGSAAAAGAWMLGRPGRARAQAVVDLGGAEVLRRSMWASGLPAPGAMPLEPEVRYLIVHHSVDPGDDYGPADVVGILRDFHRLHTAAPRGWPDVAYNFFVDRFGRLWEGRAGSLDGPVAGDATGGNQGSDQLCCFIGNHQVAEPTPEAFAAMGRLLAALGRRYDLALGPDATTTFVSRGSNRHPPGTVVATNTVAAHRDMSRTQCPGDHVVARLGELRLLAAGGAGPAATTTPAAAAPASTAPASATTSAEAAAGAPGLTEPAGPPPSGARTGGPEGRRAGPSTREDGGVGPVAAAGAGAAAAAAAVGAAAWARSRGRTDAAPGPPASGHPQ